MLSVAQSNQKLRGLIILIHKSRILIGTLGSSEIGPKLDPVFQSDKMSLC